MEATKKEWSPLKLMILAFVLLNFFLLLFKTAIAKAGFEIKVLLIANAILFLVGLYTLRNGLKSISNPNPHVFVRTFYAGFIIRLFACGIAAFIYIYANNGEVGKGSLFLCLFFYIIYSVIEVSSLQKALRNNKNA